jgi:hypothetical protein
MSLKKISEKPSAVKKALEKTKQRGYSMKKMKKHQRKRRNPALAGLKS